MNNLLNPKEISLIISNRIKNERKANKLTQEELANKTGVSLGSIKRFEQSGEISFKNLIKICFVLGLQNDLYDLFNKKTYSSIEEIINERNK